MLAFLASEQADYINGQIICIDDDIGNFSAGSLIEIMQAMKGDRG